MTVLLSYTVRESDVWLNFKSSGGYQATISVAALAERSGSIIGRALKAWASDAIARTTSEPPVTVLLIEKPNP